MTRRLAPDGTVANWVDVDIVDARNEDWFEYELSDGAVMKAKSIVAEVEKAVDSEGEPVLDEDGEPYYRIQFDSAIHLEEEP